MDFEAMLGGAVQRVVRRPFCVHSKHRVEKKAPASMKRAMILGVAPESSKI